MVLRFIYELIGDLFGTEQPCEQIGDPVDFRPGLFVDTGFWWISTFKKLLIPMEYRKLKKSCPVVKKI